MLTTIDEVLLKLFNNKYTVNFWRVREDGGIEPHLEVDLVEIAKKLIVTQTDLRQQVQTIAMEIMEWGAWEARTKRVWDITKCNYRVWRETRYLELVDPANKSVGWVKPTEKKADAKIRLDKGYAIHYALQERAEEAYSISKAIVNGFRAKKDVLTSFVIRDREDGSARLDV